MELLGLAVVLAGFWGIWKIVMVKGDLVGTRGDEFAALEQARRILEVGGENSKDYRTLYYELIMAVARKYPGETRHQTALRYIQRAETTTSGEACQSEKKA